MSGNRCASFASTRKPATPPATHTTCRRGTETGKGERDTNTQIPKTPQLITRHLRAAPHSSQPAAELRAPARGLVPGSGEERCLRAAGSTHIWRHSAPFSPVNTKTSERASAAVVTICRVTYYVALIGCRSIQLSEEAFYFLVRLKHAP